MLMRYAADYLLIISFDDYFLFAMLFAKMLSRFLRFADDMIFSP